jgi:hypothetical protein
LKRERKYQRGFTKQKSKDGYKEIKRAEGKVWYSARKAARYLGVDRHTLSGKWRFHCPWIDRGIKTREFHGPYKNLLTYYLLDDLDEIKRAQVEWPLISQFPGLVYFGNAAQELGWTERYLRKRLKRIGIKPIRKWGKDETGRRIPRSYLSREVVDEFKREQCLGQSSTHKVTIREAAKILRRSESTVRTLIARGILKPVGRERVRCKGGQIREVVLLSRAAVEKYRDEHGGHFGHAEGAGLEEAKNVLREILADGDWHLRSKVVEQAAARGVGYKRLKLAKVALGVMPKRVGRGGRWYWKMAAVVSQATANGTLTGVGRASSKMISKGKPDRPEKKAGPRGPDKGDRTKQIEDYCYSALSSGKKRVLIAMDIRTRFDLPGFAEASVTTYARRSAKRCTQERPWPINR